MGRPSPNKDKHSKAAKCINSNDSLKSCKEMQRGQVSYVKLHEPKQPIPINADIFQLDCAKTSLKS